MHFENYRVLFKSVRLAFCQFHVFPVAMPISTVFPALQQKDKEVKEGRTVTIVCIWLLVNDTFLWFFKGFDRFKTNATAWIHG